jgi:hypothetical protein
MFLASAAFFGWAGVRSGDSLVVIGSILFGSGCLMFFLTS